MERGDRLQGWTDKETADAYRDASKRASAICGIDASMAAIVGAALTGAQVWVTGTVDAFERRGGKVSWRRLRLAILRAIETGMIDTEPLDDNRGD